MTQQQRPLGITIQAILGIVGGILGLLGGCGLVGVGAFTGILGAQARVGELGILGGPTGLWGILLLALAVVELAFGIGAWTLKPWAWTLGLIVAVVGIVFGLVGLVGFREGFFSVLLRVVIYGVILYYLMTPEVKKAFGRA